MSAETILLVDLATAHPTPIDLLLTDVVMPGMSGFALPSRVTPLRAETKVLYFSGYADDYDVIREGLHDSGRPFLLKPFTQADLIKKIGEILSEQTAASGARIS